MRPTAFWQVLKNAGLQWMDDKATLLGAALAYYTIFSIAPLLVIAVAICGLLFGQKAAEGHVAEQLKNVLGDDGAQTVQTMLANANQPTSGLVATLVGAAMLFFGAASLFVQLQDVMNTIWKVKPKPGRAIRDFIRDRLLSFVMVLATAALLLISLGIGAALTVIGSLLGDWQTSTRGQVLHILASLVIFTLQFGLLFRIVPDAKVRFKDVWLGALLTAVLFTLGKWLIGLYLGHAGLASAYGAAGSLAALLVWVYYSALIFLFGAEFTKAYAAYYGTPLVPEDNAVLAEPRPPV